MHSLQFRPLNGFSFPYNFNLTSSQRGFLMNFVFFLWNGGKQWACSCYYGPFGEEEAELVESMSISVALCAPQFTNGGVEFIRSDKFSWVLAFNLPWLAFADATELDAKQ